ncbi:MAG: hypothetical protein L3I99_01915 [Sulfurimonas sp.]|nr:hypothetical protein [Sulfurimonas sp.]
MSLLKPNISYSTGAIVSPTRNLQSAFAGIGSQLDKYERSQELKLSRKREEELDNIRKAEENRRQLDFLEKKDQNREIANVFRNLNPQTQKTTTIPASNNSGVRARISNENEMNRKNLESNVLAQGEVYSNLFEKYRNENKQKTDYSAEDSKFVKANMPEIMSSERPGLMAKPNISEFLKETGISDLYNSGKESISKMFSSSRNEAAVEKSAENIRKNLPADKQEEALSKLYSNKNISTKMARPTIKEPKVRDSKKMALPIDNSAAHERALEESKLNEAQDNLTKFTGMTIPELVNKKGSSSTKSVAKTRSNFVKDAMASIRSNDKLTGTSMIAAMGQVEMVADGIYGKPKTGTGKGLTVNQSLALRKNQIKELDDQRTLISFRKMYPKSPDHIKTISAMNGFIEKEKSKKSKMKGGTKFVKSLVDTNIDSDHSLKLLQFIDKYNISDSKASSLIEIINDDYSIFPKWSGTVMDDFRKYVQSNFELK